MCLRSNCNAACPALQEVFNNNNQEARRTLATIAPNGIIIVPVRHHGTAVLQFNIIFGMGGGVSALHVSDDTKSPDYGIGFSKAMFSAKEWKALKSFCNSHDIKQTNLNGLFKQYLSADEALLRQMRVALKDFKLRFLDQSTVIREAADVFIPHVFMKESMALDPPYAADEVSFSRFVILGYTFVVQPIQDYIYDFFAISKGKFTLKLITGIYTFNIQQLVNVLCEDLKDSPALRYVKRTCNVQNDTEVSIESIMKMSVKYPIMFFQLVKFRVAFKRKFFGDKFWTDRPLFESRFFDIKSAPGVFNNVDSALVETARAIVLDYENGTPIGLTPQEIPSHGENTAAYIVSDLACTRMKTALGYRETRALILESGLQWADGQLFVDIPQTPQEDQRLFDKKLKRDFVYNGGTGFRAWVEAYVGRDGAVLRENCYRSDNRHLEYTKHRIEGCGNDEDDDEDDDESGYFYTDSESGSRSTRVTKRSKATKKSKSTAGGTIKQSSVVSAKNSLAVSAKNSSIAEE